MLEEMLEQYYQRQLTKVFVRKGTMPTNKSVPEDPTLVG
jgi:hypothetical protein